MGMGVGIEDALFVSKEDQNERIPVKKNKGVLHGFRNSVYCHKINTLHNTSLPPSSYSSPARSFLPTSHHTAPSCTAVDDIDCYYEAAESCITPSMVREGFEEIDGIIECGPQAGEGEHFLTLCSCSFSFSFSSFSLPPSLTLALPRALTLLLYLALSLCCSLLYCFLSHPSFLTLFLLSPPPPPRPSLFRLAI